MSECVRDVFKEILMSTPEYGQKKFVEALDVTFRKVDEFLCSTEGNKKLK